MVQHGFNPVQLKLTFVFRFHHDFTVVRAAFWADTVRDMIFATGFANHKLLHRERIMRAAAIATTAGDFSFWQRTHAITPSRSVEDRRIRTVRSEFL
jgi:hypothetical protein